jgi:hypothetical protein
MTRYRSLGPRSAESVKADTLLLHCYSKSFNNTMLDQWLSKIPASAPSPAWPGEIPDLHPQFKGAMHMRQTVRTRSLSPILISLARSSARLKSIRSFYQPSTLSTRE